ncbi:TLC domain-containing protein 5-like [Convolutriloba macropyga]|uniref:TLC domain-containing protein 5-like n=1 Tax=Convolutriloba macropyga TaxID=536237 RepID=UPI003F52037A
MLFVASIIFWFVLYKLLNRFAICGHQSPEWNCRVVTLIHGVFCLFSSATSALIFGPWPFTDQGGPNTMLEEFIVSVCLGYFLFDFVWCLLQPTKESRVMLIHHLLSITALFYVLYTEHSGTELMGTVFGAEASNPFLQIRWFLKEMGLRDTKMYEVNNIVFVLVFFTFRIILGTYLLITTWLHPRPTLLIKVGGTGMYIVGWIFMYDIAGYIIYFFGSKSTKRKTSLPGVNSKNNPKANVLPMTSLKCDTVEYKNGYNHHQYQNGVSTVVQAMAIS